MQLTIVTDEHVRLNTAGDGFDVIGDHFGPLQMLAASLAICTASVVLAYADTAHLSVDGFGIDLTWNYVDDPYRVGTYQMTLLIPATVPPARHKALLRAAETCTVHNTLLHAPTIATEIGAIDPAAAAHGEHVHVHRT
ncbi:MAG: hypothetical protein NVS2B7_39240 [Herpetosiphon sp.]